MASSAMRRFLPRMVASRPALRSPVRTSISAPRASKTPVAYTTIRAQSTAQRPFHSSTPTAPEEAHGSLYDPLDTFQRRHVGPNSAETEEMLKFLKYDSLDTFVKDVVPPNILSARDLKVSPADGLSETQLLARLKEIASKNKKARSYIGCGYAGTKTPAVIARNILESPEWYTSYTPYQPEISQGDDTQRNNRC